MVQNQFFRETNAEIQRFFLLQKAQSFLGTWSEKKRDYVGKIPNKIAEVIWEDWFKLYNLRNLPI